MGLVVGERVLLLTEFPSPDARRTGIGCSAGRVRALEGLSLKVPQGSIFGEVGLISGRRRGATIRAAENPTVCMELSRNAALAMGMRLCTWGEWYSACANAAALSIASMPNGWEWTNQTANEDMSVRVVGSSNCVNAATSQTTYPRYYRCCISR